MKNILDRSSKKIPLSVEATYTFLNHYLLYKDKTSNKIILNQQGVLNLEQKNKIFCIDILRFVGQLSDLHHSKKQKTVNNLMQNLGMHEHEVISEIRHASTHKYMPNIKIVVKCLKYLIVFLFEKYWLETSKKIQYEQDTLSQVQIDRLDNLLFNIQKNNETKNSKSDTGINENIHILKINNFNIFNQYAESFTAQSIVDQQIFDQMIKIITNKRQDIRDQYKQAVILNKLIIKYLDTNSVSQETFVVLDKEKTLDDYNKQKTEFNKKFIKVMEQYISVNKETGFIEFMQQFPFLKINMLKLFILKDLKPEFKIFMDKHQEIQISLQQQLSCQEENKTKSSEISINSKFQPTESNQLIGKRYLSYLYGN